MAYMENGQQKRAWSELDGLRGVYIVGDGNFVKIGWSGDIGERLRGLETARPRPLEYITVIDGVDQDFEREMHRTYAEYRERNEWFRLEGRLLEVLWPAMSGEDWDTRFV